MKKLSILIIFGLSALTSFAQEKCKYLTTPENSSSLSGNSTEEKLINVPENPIYISQTKDNWFIGLGGGASYYFGEHGFDVDGGIGKLITPNLHLQVGKWVSPIWGFRLQMGGLQLKAWESNGYRKDVNYFDLHVDGLFNPIQSFCGFSENRKWNLNLFAGVGGAKVFKGGIKTSVTLKTGLITDYRLSNAFSLFGELQGSVVPKGFDDFRDKNKVFDAYLTLSAGVIYRFPGAHRGFRTLQSVVRDNTKALNDKINELRLAQQQDQARNAQLEGQIAQLQTKLQNQPEMVIKEDTWMDNGNLLLNEYVRFAFDQTTCLPGEEIHMQNAAEELAKRKGAVLEVVGYADPRSGSQFYNMQLSKKRAEFVAEQLKTKYNVPADQISISYYGHNKGPLADNAKNKIVLFFIRKK